MSYTNSKVWVSPREAAQEEWVKVRDNLGRVRFDRSPFAPHSFTEYVEFKATRAEELAEELKLLAKRREEEQSKPNQHAWIIPFEGKSFHDNLSPVLAMPSIWSPWFVHTDERPAAPWPASEEFKEEGDERHTSGFGRFLPVPRKPGNETVVWKQRKFLEAFDMDYVNPVLFRETTPGLSKDEQYTLDQILFGEGHGNINTQYAGPSTPVRLLHNGIDHVASPCISISAMVPTSEMSVPASNRNQVGSRDDFAPADIDTELTNSGRKIMATTTDGDHIVNVAAELDSMEHLCHITASTIQPTECSYSEDEEIGEACEVVSGPIFSEASWVEDSDGDTLTSTPPLPVVNLLKF